MGTYFNKIILDWHQHKKKKNNNLATTPSSLKPYVSFLLFAYKTATSPPPICRR